MDKKWRKSIFRLLPLDGRYFLTVALNTETPQKVELEEVIKYKFLFVLEKWQQG